MWIRLTNFIVKFLTYISKHDNKETWSHLEARRNIDLENLEDLKKLRIKNF
jgi:hypothetical protein